MKQKATLLVTIFVIVSFSACKKSQTTEPEPYGEIIPLNIGNSWVTEHTMFDSSGNVTSTFIDTSMIARDTIIDNERWFAFFTKYFMNNKSYYMNKTDGYYNFYQDISEQQGKIYYIWKYPAEIKDSFSVSGSDYTVVVSSNDQIRVKAGVFNCYQYRWQYTRPPDGRYVGHQQKWLCPNVGEIKSQQYSISISGKEYLSFSSELISYKLY